MEPRRGFVVNAYRPPGEPLAYELVALCLRWIGEDPAAVQQAVSAFCAHYKLPTLSALCMCLLPPYGLGLPAAWMTGLLWQQAPLPRTPVLQHLPRAMSWH